MVGVEVINNDFIPRSILKGRRQRGGVGNKEALATRKHQQGGIDKDASAIRRYWC